MVERSLYEALRDNGWKFRQSLEYILEKYSQPFEDDLIINLEDMTYDTESGPKNWSSIDENLCLLRKQSKNKSKIKSLKSCEAGVNLKQSTKLCEVDISQAHFEKLYESDLSTNLSSQTDHTSEVLKDGQSTESMSKLQTFVSMRKMNVGDKYKIDVDMLATSNLSLAKQVVVECVGRIKDNPLITFTPTSKLKIGSSHNYNDCSDGFPDTTFKELNHSSKPHHDNKDVSNIASLSSSQTLKPPCLLNSTELYSHKLEDSGCDAMNLGETTSISVELTPMETLDDSYGLSDTTLIDIYPSMVASISHLLDSSYKTQVASRLIKHYRRLQFNASKSKSNSTLSEIKSKGWMNVQKLKRPRYHSITELKPCAGDKQMQNKEISPKGYKTSRDNLEKMFTHTVDAALQTVLQTNSKSETESSQFQNLNNNSVCLLPLLLSPCNKKTPTPIGNRCNITPLNGPTLPHVRTLTNFHSLRPWNLKSNEEPPSSRMIIHRLQNAERSPLNNSRIRQPDRELANYNRSPFGRLLCSTGSTHTSERNKLRHFISPASVPSKFHSVQNLFKTKVKEMGAFESVYQSLVQSSLCFPATMECPDILNFHSVPRKEMNSVSNITCSPSQLSRKRAACIDQAQETSRLPLKRFRSLTESSSSKQNNQDMLMPNTILQKQVYHCTQMNGFCSPRNKQDREKIAAVEFSKWKDNGLYSNSALVLPVINISENTVSLSLSPRPQKRVCRQLNYNNMNTPV